MSMLRRLILWSTVLLGSSAAPALETIAKLVPMEGAYVSPDLPNTAFFFELDEADFGFVAWYTYEDNGRATFLTLQGPVTYRNEQERRESGVIASLRSTIFTAQNGPCPTCPPRSAEIGTSPLREAELIWTSARRASIRYAGRIFGLQSLELTRPEARTIEGTWRLDSRDIDLTASNPHARARYGSAVVRIFRSPTPIAMHIHPAESASQPAGSLSEYSFGVFPSAQAAYYTMDCVSGCTNADLYATNGPESTATKPSRWVLWFEGGAWRMANTYSVSSPFPTTTQLNGGTLVGEMNVTQNQITIRRRGTRIDALLLHSADVVLSRLPDNWTRP